MLKLLQPDMPSVRDLAPYLQKIDETKCYGNFGPLNQHLEQRLSAEFGGANVVTVANATIGLEIAIAALDLYPGSRILLPAFTFPATATAVIRAGHVPFFADVDPTSWLLTPQIAEFLLDAGVSFEAVLPVCAFGAAQSLVLWDAFEFKHRIPVIVDAAAAFGNQQVETNCPVVFSMHATKTLGAGEGGFLVTNNPALADRYRRMANFGLDAPGGLVRYERSTNAKLSEYHAAVALASLDRFAETSAKRRELAAHYRFALQQHCIEHQTQYRPHADIQSTFQILLPAGVSVPQLRFSLSEHAIESRRWYYPALHQQPAFQPYARGVDLPVTQDLGKRLIGLPFHTAMNEHTVDRICRVVAATIEDARCMS